MPYCYPEAQSAHNRDRGAFCTSVGLKCTPKWRATKWHIECEGGILSVCDAQFFQIMLKLRGSTMMRPNHEFFCSVALLSVCVWGGGGITVFTRSSRLDLYGHTGVLGSGRSCVWGGGVGWLVGSRPHLPTHDPRRLPCGTRLGGRTRVSGHKAFRIFDTAPRPSGGAPGWEMPLCLCVCALVRLGGGGVWHTCLLHCWWTSTHMVRGSVCLVLQAPAGRPESLTPSPPGEMWVLACNLHVTRTGYPSAP